VENARPNFVDVNVDGKKASENEFMVQLYSCAACRRPLLSNGMIQPCICLLCVKHRRQILIGYWAGSSIELEGDGFTRVTLINPPWALEEHFKRFENVASVQQPLGLAYLAAALEKNEHEVNIIDSAVLNYTDDQIISEVRRQSPDVIGITCVTPSYRRTLDLAAKLKKELELPILIGGPHVTSVAEETMRNRCFDIAVLGEGDLSIIELVDTIQGKGDLSRVEGIAYRRESELVTTPPRPYVEDLDSLPFPARSLLPHLSKYKPTPSAYRSLPQATMITSRGCPYHCAFCDRSVFGNRYRARTAQNVVDEMELLINDYGVREIRFWDDTFNIDQQRVLAICEEILKRKLDVTWTCLGRVNHMNENILETMAKAGCWQVDYGIESGSQVILNRIMKGQTLEMVERVVAMTHKAGIGVRGFFMLGLPGETESTMKDTIRFAKSLDLTSAVFHITTPFPGTELFKIATGTGELRLDASYDEYMLGFSEDIPYVPRGLTAQRMKDFQNIAYREFYFRPSFLVKRILEIRSLRDVQRYTGAFFMVNRLG
jgi:anaerobic magnesium-protoporphyrin IX monomethyl ester cyclase